MPSTRPERHLIRSPSQQAPAMKMSKLTSTSSALFALSLTVAIGVLISSTATVAQSTKGSTKQAAQQANSYAAQSPGAQLRQQQSYQQQPSRGESRPAPISQTTTLSSATKRRQQQPIQQQKLPSPMNNYQQQLQQQREEQVSIQQQQVGPTTEDPLADSEPALYGSVAGAPGVDFPAYTKIPKTSFTCEGKGFDFGFYADEEAQCQVYHVCWSGRRESFLCGVGTVFNQAILACDYWHSVDCSKSSQFYGVNSELGKAGAEPASGGGNGGLQRQRAITPANLPLSAPQAAQNQYNTNDQQQSTGPSSNSFGEPISQRRANQQQEQPVVQQQQQQYSNNDDPIFDAPQQQQQLARATPTGGSGSSYSNNNNNNNNNNNFVPQRSTQAASGSSYDQTQQQRIEPPTTAASTKGRTQAQAPPATTTVATPPAAKRPRFNMDFNQKVNSLIESPVRPPLRAAPSPAKQRQVTSSPPPPPPVAVKSAATTTRRPAASSFAQMTVARAQQQSARPKTSPRQEQPPQQQQQQLDADLDEPINQQQQQSFADSPVQTSTVVAIPRQERVSGNYANQQQRQIANFNNNFVPQQMVIHSGGNSLDGSSAITTQYDTMQPVGVNNNNNIQQQQQQQLQNGDSSQDSSYESSLDDSASSANDDFRSAGAKAAASHNQNWYIMHTI